MTMPKVMSVKATTATTIAKYPTIGIIGKPDPFQDAWRYVSYVDELRCAILRSNGIPRGILLPNLHLNFQCKDEPSDGILSEFDCGLLFAELAEVDGVVLQGGVTCSAYEVEAAKFCLESGIPIIGICSGFNNMVRALGGEVTNIENDEAMMKRHFQTIPDSDNEDVFTLCKNAHRVVLPDALSILGKLFPPVVKVNSCHTYVAYEDQIPGSHILAICPEDGTVEAFEVPDHPFALAIKWHPELMPDPILNPITNSTQEMQYIFYKFVDKCRVRLKNNCHRRIEALYERMTHL